MTTGNTREIIQKQSDLDLGFIEGPWKIMIFQPIIGCYLGKTMK